MKNRFIIKNVSLAVKKNLYTRMVVPKVLYGVEILGLGKQKKHRLNFIVIDMKSEKSLCRGISWYN